ncbi:fused ATPase/permease component of ABC-type transporter involved in cytochrome bd biogenesis [Mycolicibacterium chubuense NBB4]|uniref:Fused ATPase/permease component of ABC-type transporter involved in cytochrome bd biogenesis n=1 Tax=Mycolicibacterium chubuense (strain NBB4) TaxID=710421 RepID=I4BJ66_MYCCN|nr:ATP-binding cassette domain-containing protein [Mycolicibacterium chubuense]AFM17323.1 fused ATPase/permease component of ABC-type transporter involved in cytochrome bd biogenesis [Mycolicibacterium chubuense NBB4]
MAVAFGVLSLGSALALAAVAAWLITRAWQMPPVLDLTVAVVAVRALGISRGLLGYCERLASHDTALRAAGTAREQFFTRLASGPAEAVLRRHSGELVAGVGSGVDELADVLVRAVIPICVAVVLGLAAVGVIAVISPAAAAVLAVCLVIAGAVAPAIAARSATAAETVAAEHHSRRDTAVLLVLEHAPELRVSGRLPSVIAEAGDEQRRWGRAIDRAAAPGAVAAAAPTAAMGVSVLAAVVAGVALSSAVAPTTVAILMLLPLSAFEATAALPGAAVTLSRARIAARRLRALLEPVDDDGRRPASPPLQVTPGARIVVVGPSGCGKTTLLMRTPGTFFAEDAHLFSTTVRDNLLVARGDADDDGLRAALQKVGLGAWLDDLPDGLSTVLVGGAAAVSAGQRRRLLLARALVSAAPTVLLDEPTEHLDTSDAERLLVDILTPGELFGADRAVVVATHHLPKNLSTDGYSDQHERTAAPSLRRVSGRLSAPSASALQRPSGGLSG